MKILIMVLSYNEGAFAQLMRTQMNTWDTQNAEGVSTVYYHGGGEVENINSDMVSGVVLPRNGSSFQLVFNCTDAYYYMAGKFKYALNFIDLKEYDYIFRTNSSSYVNKKLLLEFAEKLPKEKLYGGWTFIDSEDHGGLCVSGAGIWLSRDTAEILMNEIDPEKELEEDVYCGRILRKHGITAIDDKSRFDIPTHYGIVPFDRYHYRCKGGIGNRIADIGNMKKLHHLIMSNP